MSPHGSVTYVLYRSLPELEQTFDLRIRGRPIGTSMLEQLYKSEQRYSVPAGNTELLVLRTDNGAPVGPWLDPNSVTQGLKRCKCRCESVGCFVNGDSPSHSIFGSIRDVELPPNG